MSLSAPDSVASATTPADGDAAAESELVGGGPAVSATAEGELAGGTQLRGEPPAAGPATVELVGGIQADGERPAARSAKDELAAGKPVRGKPAAAKLRAGDPAGAAEPAPAVGFQVRLVNFSGPFDLLLQLIGKHKMDVTEVALHKVTDEFIAYIRAMGDAWDLDEVSEFLVIATTLLDLKAARLLPTASVEDEEDLAQLEARDLLFARLLQYKAYKEAAAALAGLESSGSRRHPRAVPLEPRYAEALPDLVLGIGPQRLAALAAATMQPKKAPVVSVDHIHMVRVSVREHAALLRDMLMRQGTSTFRALCSDCQSTLEIVARFLALLELYCEGLVSFDQVQALGELTVRWIGGQDVNVELDIDEYAGAPVDRVIGVPAETSHVDAGEDLS